MADLPTYKQKGELAVVSSGGLPKLSSLNAIYISYSSFRDCNPLQTQYFSSKDLRGFCGFVLETNRSKCTEEPRHIRPLIHLIF